MIDTIRAKISVDNLGELHHYFQSEGKDYFGNNYRKYKIKNISIRANEFESKYELTIIGSLSKFLFDTNLVRFTRVHVKDAILNLSNMIGIDLSDAFLKRVDLAANLNMANKVEIYLQLLSDKSRFKRSSIRNNETVSFVTRNKSLSFYNKKKEFNYRNRNKPVLKNDFSSFLKDKNLIRYELKLNKLLDISLTGAPLKLKELHNKAVYKTLVNLWYSQYTSIRTDNLTAFKRFNKFDEYLMYRGIKAIGGLSDAYTQLNAWVNLNKIDNQKKYRTRIKLLKIFKNIKKDKLIKELDKKIKFEKEFYL